MNKRSCKLVLGNGFDLFCKLSTRYEDFFAYNKARYSLIENEFNELHNYYSKSMKTSLIPVYNAVDDLNFWDIFFYFDPRRKQKKNWLDVEKFIYDFFNDESLDNNMSLFDYFYNYQTVKKPNYEDEAYLWKAYCIYYIRSKFKKSKIKTKIDFSTFLLNELILFEKSFGRYVFREFTIHKKNYYIGFLTFFNDVESIWEIATIDTFNYTPLEDVSKLFFGKWQKQRDVPVVHINGNYENPIFGIDSSKISTSKPAFIYTKTYRRIMNDFFEIGDFKNYLNSQFDDLVIFGHSLNKQDYNYYFPLFDYMELFSATSNKSIVFYYYIYDEHKRRSIKEKNIKNLIEMLNEYEEHRIPNKHDSRLVDSLSAQGRLKFKELKLNNDAV